jgi:hypothetical protein
MRGPGSGSGAQKLMGSDFFLEVLTSQRFLLTGARTRRGPRDLPPTTLARARAA